jgi:hypothetical protein
MYVHTLETVSKEQTNQLMLQKYLKNKTHTEASLNVLHGSFRNTPTIIAKATVTELCSSAPQMAAFNLSLQNTQHKTLQAGPPSCASPHTLFHPPRWFLSSLLPV